MKTPGLQHPQTWRESSAMKAPVRRAFVAVRVVMAGTLVSGGALVCAAGPVGTVGPVGQLGPSRSTPAAPSPAADLHRAPKELLRAPSAAVGAAPGAPAGAASGTGNHIEVTGNTVVGTRCTHNGTASVNSIDVSRARLNGQTVVVQGRNSQSVDTRDCPPHADGAAADRKAPQVPAQTNSIRIR